MIQPMTQAGRALLSWKVALYRAICDIEAEAVAVERARIRAAVEGLEMWLDPRDFPPTEDVLVSEYVRVSRAAVLAAIEGSKTDV
jgi:hypothetical protein